MPEERPAIELVHGVPPVAVSTGSTLANRTGSWKYIRPVYQDMVSPCNAGCPVGIDIEGYMNLLREGHVAEARDLLLRENPLPAVTGRVCNHPCEGVCSRQQFDGAVSIHAVERALGDLDHEDPTPITPSAARKEQVAVVGSGPAGLSCAYHLARLGYAVQIFEADPEPGGSLRYAVPDHRLPKNVLAREIERLRALGVRIQCRVQVGKNPAWDELKRFDAVFLATGARVAPSLGLPGDDLPQIQSGLDFLRKVNTGGSAELGRRVVVVGGNSLALDCARAALRLGAAPLVVFAGRREEMTATPQEIEEALAEGVRFEFQAKPVELQTEPHAENEPALDAIRSMYAEGAEAGAGQHLSGLECLRTGPTGDGADSDHFILPVDAVLVAESPKLQFGYLPSGVAADGGGVTVDDFGATARSAFFAGGALAEGTRDVAHAIGSGKRAAIGIDRYLRERAGETLKPADPAALRYGKRGNLSMTRWRGDDPIVRTGEVNEVVLFEQLNMAHFQPVPRNPDRQRSLKERRNGFAEANLGLTRAEALAEARRCFNCGVCNQCELCLIFCPDVAIKRHGERAGFSISYKYCKGCGVCVEECPRGAITMTREGL